MNRQQMQTRIDYIGERTGLTLKLETWSPGDGWTRYSIKNRLPDGGVVGFPTEYRVYRKREFESVLLAMVELCHLGWSPIYIGRKS